MNDRLQRILKDWPLWQLAGIAPKMADLQPIAGGLTNQSFYFSCGGEGGGESGGDYLLRVEAENTQQLDIDRQAEWRAQQLAADAGICPKILYRNTQKHYWIRRYFRGQTLSENRSSQSPSQSQIQQLAGCLKKLHQLPIDDSLPRLNIASKAEKYWQVIEQSAANQPLLKYKAPLQQKLAGLSNQQLVVCHMDCGLANWFVDQQSQQLYLLDWEYAALGNPYWDLAALVEGGQLTPQLSHQKQQWLLECYGDIDSDQLHYACQQMNYLAALWYLAQGMISVEQAQAKFLKLS
ncbi:choline/ethanolamine kinase family protein [Pelagibaculum spongiae]|uniref:Aminoglycoside phosphotransferase domain-containing protein n=1 Tax=Pelagibaculum spongiae TaxID=2080658 RepID=A0A2V1GZ59_9GAMM|nr:choline/ethanolamine kinase family protein [Pelagibaculum spongiae]PVZ67792.1 hypothetical protein DC094_15295 [Pelagibaculum spongiae]